MNRSRGRGLAAVVVVAGLTAGVLTSCGSRDRARDDLVEQLVQGGLGDDLAECVVDAFFDGRDDAELREFFARDELTDDERQEFARLGEGCAADG